MNWDVTEATIEQIRCWLAALRGMARGFTYPDARWLATLRDGSWCAALAEVLGPLGLSAKGMERAIAALSSDQVAALLDLEVEYTYLFINAVPHVPAPPYASAYSDQGLLMGEPAAEAMRAYRAAGVTLADDYDNLPDHLAVELEFVAWLGEQAIEAWEAGDGEKAQERLTQQEAFLRHHLSWLPAFLDRLEEAARIPFYRELGLLTRSLLSVTPTSDTAF